ncbi:enoyl-CoA hydratase-related protein [uncultured Maritimibacter sp.]|uniref:enoyl-CoA hydratase-related protein n=1 Tax=uncultured Maritimibacter sp. TaxID=991866 RepID=UPI000A575FF0|nr:enoyl-CoA hydratase-related protein [uncultured Maritimibacter sp.]
MTLSFIETEIDEGVATLRFNSPQDRNALSRLDQCIDISEALAAINGDSTVKVAILTGKGASFCAGGNIKDMKAKTGFMAGSPTEMAEGYRRGLQRIPLAFEALEVPVIAAVNGHALGAGLDIACMARGLVAGDPAARAEQHGDALRDVVWHGVGPRQLMPTRPVASPDL